MLHKWTFSLASLVILLVFVVSSAMADKVGNVDHFGVKLTLDETVEDVSSEEGIQVESGRTRENSDITQSGQDIVVLITFDRVVQLSFSPIDAAVAAERVPLTTASMVADLFSDEISAWRAQYALDPNHDDDDDTTPELRDLDSTSLSEDDDNDGVRELILTVTIDASEVDFLNTRRLAFNAQQASLLLDLQDAGTLATQAAGIFSLADIIIEAYDKDNRSLGVLTTAQIADEPDVVTLRHKTIVGAGAPDLLAGREFTLEIQASLLQDLYDTRLTNVDPDDSGLPIYTLLISVKHKGVQDASIDKVSAHRADPENADKKLAHNAASNVLNIALVNADEGNAKYLDAGGEAAGSGVPGVISITRVLAPSGFSAVVDSTFDVRVLLTEKPAKDAFKLDVINGAAGNIKYGLPLDMARLTMSNAGGSYDMDDSLPEPTGRDNKYHQYRATITPAKTGNVIVTVASFDDLVSPASDTKTYVPLTTAQRKNPDLSDETRMRLMDGREILTVSATVAAAADIFKPSQTIFDANPTLKVLDEKLVIPKNGYLALVKGGDEAKSGVVNVSAKPADKKTDAQELYNVKYGFGLPFPASDLDNFFRNGGSLSLVQTDIPANTAGADADKGYTGAKTKQYAAGAVMISEIMWGLDGASTDSQYIELHNTTAEAIEIDKNEWAISVGSAPASFTVIDTVGNNPDSAGFWEVPGDGGRTAPGEAGLPVVDIVSMSRVTDGTDGTAEASWAASMRPSANLNGRRIGTPGAANKYDTTARDAAADAAAKADADAKAAAKAAADAAAAAASVSVATAADIAISEIMYSTGHGNLPQWIELHNMSASEVSLEGWNVEIENDGGSDLTITLGAITVGVGEKGSQGGQAVLLVSKNGRNSGMGAEEGDLRRVVNLKDLGVTGTLLSSTGFTITLSPPPAAGSSVRTDGDVAGGMDWELPMMDDDRSSLIREKDADGTYKDGSMRMSWHPTSSTGRYGTYYGHPSDMGTPGYVKGGALPVELSMFYPARDKLTGQVVITWETQSELNNAGFFIKRSEAKNGKFVVINPTMIPGAGTTAEKQSYTHTDTTAKPNVLYYYQIEDVSLDGKRATLTGAHRLRGHIGAAGKVTTIWGELKAQE